MIGSVSIVTIMGLLLQLAGFIRMAIIAAVLGLNADVDAYYLGLAIPALFIGVIANWVQLTFLGRYATLIAEKQQAEAHTLKWAVLTIAVIVTGLFACMVFLFPQHVLALLVDDARVTHVATALKYLCLLAIPVVVADFMGQTLNGHQKFAVAAFAPLANAIVAVLALLWWSEINLQALIFSLLMGGVVQLLIVAPKFLSLQGAVRKPTEHQTSLFLRTEVVTILQHSLWVVPAVLLANAMLSILQFSVAHLETGAVAQISYANRINSGIAQLLIIGLGTVLIPHFARLIANHEHSAIVDLLSKLTRGSVFACIFISAALFQFGEPLITLMFLRGNFAESDARIIAGLLFCLSMSLLPLALGTYVARYFNTLRRMDLILYSSLLSFTTTVMCCALATLSGNVYLFALVPLVTFSATTVYWLYFLAQRANITPIMRALGSGFVKTVFIITPAVAVDLGAQYILAESPAVFAVTGRAGLFVIASLGIAYLTGLHKWILEQPLQSHTQA